VAALAIRLAVLSISPSLNLATSRASSAILGRRGGRHHHSHGYDVSSCSGEDGAPSRARLS
jgi:hypothetical protein